MTPSNNVPNPCRIVTSESAFQPAKDRAAALAARLHCAFVEPDQVPPRALRLVLTDRRLELRPSSSPRDRPIYVDFVFGPTGYRRIAQRGRKSLIARAVGFKVEPISVLDATAGFARDAFLLASLGCRVAAIERSPVVAALVDDALTRARAAQQPRIDEALSRITFLTADARDVLRSVLKSVDAAHFANARFDKPRHGAPLGSPDVVYLDPMYPPGRKSALNRKELRVLRSLVGDDDDAAELFDIARRVARRRVVVKRPRHAPFFAPDPDIQFKGSSIRCDVYLRSSRTE